MAKAKAAVSEDVSASKPEVTVVTAEPVKGKFTEKATRGTLDKR